MDTQRFQIHRRNSRHRVQAFGRLVYLDHAGATLYSELKMDSIFKELTSSVCGNPHSQRDTSMATSKIVREARQQVLDFCNASPKDYSCIFTSGATSALKLVGETFPWSSNSCFFGQNGEPQQCPWHKTICFGSRRCSMCSRY